MSEGGSGRGWNILAGTFLVMFGLCVLLVGGLCSAMWLSEGSAWRQDSTGVVLTLISLATAGSGAFAVYHGIRMAIGRRGG
ncbi:MAG TPA: hypothetical protein VF727_05300 [Allosphingosinicella sp.]|jgi:hypothetical protein